MSYKLGNWNPYGIEKEAWGEKRGDRFVADSMTDFIRKVKDIIHQRWGESVHHYRDKMASHTRIKIYWNIWSKEKLLKETGYEFPYAYYVGRDDLDKMEDAAEEAKSLVEPLARETYGDRLISIEPGIAHIGKYAGGWASVYPQIIIRIKN